MNAAIFAAPIPVVYLSPQAISPLSASTTPIAMNLPNRVDIADPAATTSAKLKQDQRGNQLLGQQQPASGAKSLPAANSTNTKNSNQLIVLDGKVDVYV
jgi:hypothetical protein